MLLLTYKVDKYWRLVFSINQSERGGGAVAAVTLLFRTSNRCRWHTTMIEYMFRVFISVYCVSVCLCMKQLRT